jgi:hypothetical protein
MKLNRGCGCLTLVLGAINVFVVISVLIGIVSNKTGVGIGLAMVVVFVGNVAVCVFAGLGSVRRAQTSTLPGGGEADELAEGEDESGTEGEDE